MILPMEIYSEFAADVKKVNKLGDKVVFENIGQVIFDKWHELCIKQGYSDEQADYYIEKMWDDENIEVSRQIQQLKLMVEWNRCGKQVFRFDKDLAEILQTSDDLEIPLECFKTLPIKSFYVQIAEDKGFFFLYEAYTQHEFYKEEEPYFTIFSVDNKHCDILSIVIRDGMKLSEKLSSVKRQDLKIGDKKRFTEIFDLKDESKANDICLTNSIDAKPIISKVSKMLQLVIYLAAINAEITDVRGRTVAKEATSKVAKKAKKSIKNGGNIVPKEYYVGKAFGEQYRQMQREQAQYSYHDELSEGAKKRPHVRRAHFHHYWTGSGDDKVLIVKWVHSVFVNRKNADDVVPTVHSVKGDKL